MHCVSGVRPLPLPLAPQRENIMTTFYLFMTIANFRLTFIQSAEVANTINTSKW